MFDELEKYNHHGNFQWDGDSELKENCNAPENESGVFLVFALRRFRVDLVYIGWSGVLPNDTLLSGRGGLRQNILNARYKSSTHKVISKKVMKTERLEALDIYWYVTGSVTPSKPPNEIAELLLSKYRMLSGSIPKWNVD